MASFFGNVWLKLPPILLAVLLVSCNSNSNTDTDVVTKVDDKNYKLGSIYITTVGNVMIKHARYTIIEGRLWTALPNGSSGWQINRRVKDGGSRHEVVFRAGSSNTIKLQYQEYDMAGGNRFTRAKPVKSVLRQAASKEQIYDLKHSRLLKFLNYSFRILDANQNMVKYQVVAD